jgi:hypothetical protein
MLQQIRTDFAAEMVHAELYGRPGGGSSRKRKQLHPGDAAFLCDGPKGPVLELDEWRVR